MKRRDLDKQPGRGPSFNTASGSTCWGLFDENFVDFLSGKKNIWVENICDLNNLKAGRSTVWGLIEHLVNELDKEVVVFNSFLCVCLNTAVYWHEKEKRRRKSETQTHGTCARISLAIGWGSLEPSKSGELCALHHSTRRFIVLWVPERTVGWWFSDSQRKSSLLKVGLQSQIPNGNRVVVWRQGISAVKWAENWIG